MNNNTLHTRITIQVPGLINHDIDYPYSMTPQEVSEYSKILPQLFEYAPWELTEMLEQWQNKTHNLMWTNDDADLKNWSEKSLN